MSHEIRCLLNAKQFVFAKRIDETAEAEYFGIFHERYVQRRLTILNSIICLFLAWRNIRFQARRGVDCAMHPCIRVVEKKTQEEPASLTHSRTAFAKDFVWRRQAADRVWAYRKNSVRNKSLELLSTSQKAGDVNGIPFAQLHTRSAVIRS